MDFLNSFKDKQKQTYYIFIEKNIDLKTEYLKSELSKINSKLIEINDKEEVKKIIKNIFIMGSN